MDGVDLLAIAANTIRSLSIFDPASHATESIVNLAILAVAIIGLIFIVVEGVLLYCVWRFREPPMEMGHAAEPPQVYGSQAIEMAWTAAPTLIVMFLVLVTARTLWEINISPPKPTTDDPALVVTVIGHQWWWEYVYKRYDGRELKFVTANELHMPVSDTGQVRPVHLVLKSADVCHSFWAPRLAGKVDLIPGRTNSLVLETSESGLYLGQCAEYCGAQHANMLIRVVVETPAEFEQWLENQQRVAVDDPAAAEGKATFLAQSCTNCHCIRGTAAAGTYAPDLTHLMSRETLASGQIKNTPENLREWVHDPQTIKPDCLMPAFGLSERERDLIVDYLLTLR